MFTGSYYGLYREVMDFDPDYIHVVVVVTVVTVVAVVVLIDFTVIIIQM